MYIPAAHLAHGHIPGQVVWRCQEGQARPPGLGGRAKQPPQRGAYEGLGINPQHTLQANEVRAAEAQWVG
jgi:hypothetical protein